MMELELARQHALMDLYEGILYKELQIGSGDRILIEWGKSQRLMHCTTLYNAQVALWLSRVSRT